MAAATRHFTGTLRVKVGYDWAHTILIETAVDTPRNLAGWTARMRIRPTLEGSPLVELTEGDGITIVDAEGSIALRLTAEQTAAFEPTISEASPATAAVRPAELWVYDFDLVRQSDDFVDPYLEGHIAVEPRVAPSA